MKASAFLVFFSIVFIIYGLVNYYIYSRAYQALEAQPSLKPWFTTLFLTISLSYIAGRFLERAWISIASDILTGIGSFWLAAMLYFFLIVVFIDLIRLVNYFFPFLSSLFSVTHSQLKWNVFLFALIGVSVLVISGYFNARMPRIRELELTIDKEAHGRKELRIAMASDIHLGTMVGRSKISRIVRMLNDLHPDIIVLCGDIVDEDLGAVIRENLGDELRNLKAPLGIYAITGNHEYIGGAESAVKYYTDHGIRVLRDTAILVNDSFYLVGREDKDRGRFTGKKRKEIPELLEGVDHNRPIIMLDHQPFHLEKVTQAGVDLQLSGHTHHGQLWPFNYLTNAIYELSWGYKQKGATHFYVSSGAGTWGPPVRLGNRPEIVSVRLSFVKRG